MSASFVAGFHVESVYPTGKVIGSGVFGRVFEVDYEGTLCAAKEMHGILLQQDSSFNTLKDNFLKECHTWSMIRHPFIVQFLGMPCTASVAAIPCFNNISS